MRIKFLLFGGRGGFWAFSEGGGWKCRFYFYGRGDFSDLRLFTFLTLASRTLLWALRGHLQGQPRGEYPRAPNRGNEHSFMGAFLGTLGGCFPVRSRGRFQANSRKALQRGRKVTERGGRVLRTSQH